MAISSRYRIADVEDGDVREFTCLHHVAHVRDARRIIEDRRINPELIRDESVLNQTRISVVWTSPNTWFHGSMYGNVSFTLPITTLDDRHYYWVEAIEKYNPTALRILVSSNHIENKHLVEFDPTELDVPLHRSADGKWWRYGRFNYEIMFDEHFTLSECERIEFFDHHRQLCNKSGGSCSDAGHSAKEAAARIGALALSLTDSEQLAELLLASSSDSDLVYGISKIGIWLSKRQFSHKAPTREERASLFAAGMYLYAYELNDHAKATLVGLESDARALKILLRRAKEVFGDTIHMKLEHEFEL